LNNLVISTEELKKIAENRLNKLINEKELLSKNINLSIQYNESVTKHKTLQKQLEELTSKLKAIKYDEAKEKQYNELSSSLPQLKNQLATLIEKNRQLQELKSQQESLEKNLKDLKQDLSEYIIISDMCGPNGIPSIKIDAVIPEVESIANNLLQESNWGYQIRLETQKESVQKNKYKILETLEIVVLDETDRLTKLVSDLSIGQRSVISEAINLALAIIAKQKGIIDIETLFRDETTSNLNREAATNYVKLLRNAMNMGGFKNLIYITHQDFLLSQMDHVVNFER
jgi:DNA repair exonuclease SbcCD ATPase subunit